jgi:hypothetical protein
MLFRRTIAATAVGAAILWASATQAEITQGVISMSKVA